MGVRVVSVDIGVQGAVGDSAELRALDQVTGIFHLAGVLDDGLISNMTRERVHAVLAPKTHGLLALLAMAQEKKWDLDFATTFSSTSSLFGYPGQSNYCGANAVLDQLASWGACSTGIDTPEDGGPCILAMNWGPWGDAGMAAAGTKAHAQALRDGDTPLKSHDALAALTTALASRFDMPQTTRQFAVCDVEWSKSPWKDLPVVRQVLGEEMARKRDAAVSDMWARGDGGNAGLQSLGRSSNAPTTQQLLSAANLQAAAGTGAGAGASVGPGGDGGPVDSILKEMVPRWAPNESLAALGMDSLDLVQLRNTANRKLGMKAPLSTYMKPNRTLQELRAELLTILAEKE